MTELLMAFARWTIPPCLIVGTVIGLSTPLIRDLKAMVPPGFSLRHPPAAPPDLDKQIERLLRGN